MNRQNLYPLVPKERIRQLAPEETTICLYPAQFFSTVRKYLVADGAIFYQKFGAVDQIQPDLAIQIADFGLGSDSPILLDYRDSLTQPKVLRLYWPGNGKPNEWRVLANDFQSFMDALGL